MPKPLKRISWEVLERRDLLAGDLPLITEFMASNENTMRDSFGDSADWIEIHNPTDAAIDLAGWSLTDDASDLQKWRFFDHPTSVLSPFEYLIVFASGRDTIAPDRRSHANFKLSAGGEYLALVSPDSKVVSEFGSSSTEYPPQETDVSFGIQGAPSSTSDSSAVRYFDSPTPGAANHQGFLGLVADTKFSVDRGFYDAPFRVEIRSDTEGASIYYTSDGSVPHPENPSAQLYSATVPIERTTNLRAAAFKNDYLPTNVDTQTYVFLEDVLSQDPRGIDDNLRAYPETWQGGFRGDYEMDSRVVDRWSDSNPENRDSTLTEGLLSIPTISLTLDHADLWDSSNGIYPNADKRGTEWRRPGSIEYIDPNSDAEFQYNVGIAMHGSASRLNSRLLKHSFRLRFHPRYDGPSRLEFPLFDNSDFANINQIILRAGFTDAFATRTFTNRYSPLDSTYLRDVWMRDAQLAAGGTAAQSTFVHLYINGLYWGVYNPAERSTDEQFFTAHFGGDPADWDIRKDFNELSSGNSRAWQAMFDIAREMDESNADEKYQEIQGKDRDGKEDSSRTNYLNMDRFIDYVILHLFAGAEDWPHNNWHAGFNRENPGMGYQFHTWDQEIALDQLARDRTEISDEGTPGELYRQLRQSSEFRLRVADRIEALFWGNGPLTTEHNQSRWMARASQIESAMIAESARWGDAREGQRVTAYSVESPLPSGTGAVPIGVQTIPLMTVDHWRANVSYVSETFFPGAFALFMERMREDSIIPSVPAPTVILDGKAHYSGEIVKGSEINILGEGDVYFTLDGSDPRRAGGEIQGARFVSALTATEDAHINARTLRNGVWSPMSTALLTVSAVEGDLTADSLVNGEDIDALFAAISANTTSSKFDLNGDNAISRADSAYLIENVLNSRSGDFDLNGKVEFADFLILAGNYNRQETVSWHQGDANGDGNIDFSDFLEMESNFGFNNLADAL